MWDELFGIGIFVVLFVGGLLIYDFVKKWQARKAKEREKRTPEMNGS